MKRLLLLFLSGAVAGAVNGFFGTGGGLVAVAALSLLGVDVRRRLAVANVAVLLFSLASFAVYRSNAVGQEALAAFFKRDAVAAVVGGGAGALLSGVIPTGVLSRLFCLVLIFCGMRALLG